MEYYSQCPDRNGVNLEVLCTVKIFLRTRVKYRHVQINKKRECAKNTLPLKELKKYVFRLKESDPRWKYGIKEGMMSKESGKYVGTSKQTLTKRTIIGNDNILWN